MTRALKRFAFLPMALDAQYPAILQSAISTPCDDVCSCFMAKQYYMYDFRVEDWALPSLGNTVWYRLAFCLRPHCVFIIGAIMKSNIITQLYVYHVLYCILSYRSTLPIELHFCLRGRPCVRNCCRKGGKGHSNHSSCLTKMSIALMTRKNNFPILIFKD